METLIARIGILLVLTTLHGCASEAVGVSDTVWECSNSVCHVEFTLTNQRDVPVDARFAVRAHRRVRIHGTKGWRNEVAGELIEPVTLDPSAVRRLERDIEITGRPNTIVVTAWIAR